MRIAPALGLSALVALVVAAASPAAQPPKKDAPPKLNIPKIAAAEAALTRAKCQFVRERDPKHALFNHTRLVNFPDTTTDASLKALIPSLKELPALTGIDVGGTKVTDAGVAELAALQGLEALYLDRTALTDKGVEALVGLKRLYWLDIGYTKVTGEGLAAVGKMTGLEHLSLAGLAKTTDDDLAAVAALEAMRELTLPLGITEAGLKHVAGMKALTGLGFGQTKIGDEGAKHLGNLSKLEYLSLPAGGGLTNVGLQSLMGCTGLKTLRISSCPNVTAAGVTGFGELNALTYLDLTGCGVTDEGLKAVAACAALKQLRLSSTKVTAAGVGEFAEAKALTFLDLTNTEVTDDGLKAVAKCPALVSLYLGSTKITDAGLPELNAVKSLTTLVINNTAVTNAGLAKLEKPKTIKYIDAVEAKVTQPGASRYMSAVPKSIVTLKYPTEAAGPALRDPGPAARPLRAPPVVNTGSSGKP